MKLRHLNVIASAALLLMSGTASAHITYGSGAASRNFGTIVPGAAPITISNQTVTSNFGWADGTDADHADSHKLRYYRFNVATPGYFTITFSGSTNGDTRDGSIKPAFSLYRGLAHVPPITNAPGSADYDTSAISLAYRATLGYTTEGSFHALKTWRIGGDNQTGPTFDFNAPDGLSTFTYVTHIADGDSTLFGAAPGVVGDGNADGTVTKSLYLTAGDYTIAVGGANYAGQAPTPDATVYGLVGTVSAAVFTYTAGDPAAGGIGYQHQVTLGNSSFGSFSGLVGAWSWEDNSLFDAGEPPVGWTHTSNWAAVSVQNDTVLTITMERDANVPWAAAPPELNGLGDTASMFPSFTIFRGLDNDGDDDHTYNNRGNVSWAEDIQYLDHVDNSTATSVTRTYFLRAGTYTLALGSNAPSTTLDPMTGEPVVTTNRQGYKISFSTNSSGAADPVPNTYLPPDYIGTGGVGYAFTVVAGANETGSFKSLVGPWSWEDNSLFGNPGQGAQPVGWTHTSNWVAVKLTQEVFFSLTLERDATVPSPTLENPSRLADTSSMFPSLTLYRGWDNDGSDDHTYNNRGNVAWAEDIRYLDHVDNSSATKITRTWRLPAGEYSFALGSNASSNVIDPITGQAVQQGYKATYSTSAASNILAADPVAGGIGYSHIISVGRGDSGSFSNHVGAWSWEDNDLFGKPGQGTTPVGWTHTSRWAAVHVRDHLTLNITMARDTTVPDIASTSGFAEVTSMFPSFTLWRGWDNDGSDSHTYNNRGNVSWAEDLSYIDHCDNSTAFTITRSYTLAPGYYTFALGSNAAATDADRQGFSFSWTTGAPAFVRPVITQQPRGAEILATRSATFSMRAVGPGLRYQWFFKGRPLENANRDTLNVTNADLDDAGAYTCEVRNSAGWATSNPAMLVVIARPVVAPFDIPNLIVGQPYQLQLVASNNPTAFAVKGLPKGLVFNPKTGLINGRPTEIKAVNNVEVIATNRAGASARVTDSFAVTGLLAGTSGSFTGPLGRSGVLNDLLGGAVRLDISSLGALSGTITLGKTAPYRIAAPLDTSAALPTAHFHIERKGLPELHIELTLDIAAKTIFGEITDDAEVLPFVARQALSPVGTYPGDYTFALPLSASDVGDQTIPQGHSIGAFKIAAAGATTGVVVTADNNRFTFGGALEIDGKLTLFGLLYRGAGSVVGLISIDSATSDLALSEVSWFKDVVAKDLVYGDGFGPLELTTIGRKYSTPVLTVLALGATAGAGNAKITFAEGGAPSPATRLDTSTLQIALTKVTVATPNPGKVALSIDKGKPVLFTPGTSGSFKGSFELTDSDTSVTPNRNLVRKSEFQGMIVDNGTEVKGYGFFLLPKMPTASPKTTLATSPRLSGSVLLEKVNLE
jgi:hypothetical protein